MGWGSIPDSPERALQAEPGTKRAGGRGSRRRDQRVPRVGMPTRLTDLGHVGGRREVMIRGVWMQQGTEKDDM